MQSLEGKNAFVTGAANGIGLGIGRALARAGVNVALADVEEEALERARAGIAGMGVKSLGISLDVTDAAQVRQAAERVAGDFGKLHILVNNAGVAFPGSPLLGVPPEKLEWIFNVNVFGILNCLRSFLPLVERHGEGGHVVNTASIGGLQVNPQLRNGPYAMTKYSVVALSEALALDLEGTGIGVSVLCPGLVATTLAKSSSRRPARFGGPYREDATARPAVMPSEVMSAGAVGDRVLHAIRNDEFFVFTHPETRAWIERRHRRLMDGFDRLDSYRAEEAP